MKKKNFLTPEFKKLFLEEKSKWKNTYQMICGFPVFDDFLEEKELKSVKDDYDVEYVELVDLIDGETTLDECESLLLLQEREDIINFLK